MDYPYENLDPETFQKFCQSLIVREFPESQCLPVAQPDGGRDSIHRMPNIRRLVVFQVKFVRDVTSLDASDWLMQVVKQEGPKVARLVPRGLARYVLMTNVRGTAHLDTGKIDRMNSLLAEAFNVPAQCWWRDDLNRRLDSAWDLKWVYPELMTGPDLIRYVIERGIAAEGARRASAIRAFVRDQFQIDQEVRFKQVDLQNNLLDLFIDLPVTPAQGAGGKKRYIHMHRIQELIARDIGVLRDDFDSALEGHLREDRLYIGAATLALHPLGQSKIARMVLEGAPGQGKSTIAQYVCQIHRMRLLERSDLLSQIPLHHQNAPLRLPFKVDLRDLATWLSGKNPFSADEHTSGAGFRRSLESFLAGQVSYHSGGTTFGIEDLLAVSRISSILLVFDGLDEVADIETRKEVVDEIINGVARLEENAASIQVIVTSRPAAFANSPGLPEEQFPYFQLESVTRNLIDEYSEKWLRARKLFGREASSVRRILKEKLDQPHLKDLARNPMQLTILLSLIHIRGSSLPDKRTSLYDNYVELFFNREAEKSAVVREHRDLLINIHRFLAWTLHVEAEQGSSSGSMKEEDLRSRLSQYLATEGYDTNLVDTLFTGMVERVVAIVSRVQGTYEFEVQPLREYFAARYLYETAPYSPPGDEKRGTKPDRFDTIARNFYWLNVTRFYAGCYSKGELASLIDSLQDLIKDDGYKLISYPRILASMLLADWVFAQHPKSVREVIRMIIDGLGLRYVLVSSSRRFGSGNQLILPRQCGRDELLDHCFSMLEDGHPRDFAFEITNLIQANGRAEELRPRWEAHIELHQDDDTRVEWLEYGLHLGLLADIPEERLQALVPYSPAGIELLLRSRRLEAIERYPMRLTQAVDAILDQGIKYEGRRRFVSLLDYFSFVVGYASYTHGAVSHIASVPLLEMWKSNYNYATPAENLLADVECGSLASKCCEIVLLANRLAQRSALEWANSLEPWDLLVEELRSNWGERWACFNLANIGAGIKSQLEECKDFNALFDHSKSLCRRARYARLRAGFASWWPRQFEAAATASEKAFGLLLMISWAGPSTIRRNVEKIDELVRELDAGEWERLYSSCRASVIVFRREARDCVDVDASDFSRSLDGRTILLIMIRSSRKLRTGLFDRYLSSYTGNDRLVVKFAQERMLDLLASNRADWSEFLVVVERAYQQGLVAGQYYYQTFRRKLKGNAIPVKIAQQVALSADRYPSFIVAAAEARCREIVASRVVPVGEVVQREKWTFA